MFVYAATIFLSAFLLFQVQPMIAKFILPWFGGSAAVWSASLLFFQLLLLAGYLYAHCLIRYLKPKQQMIVHCTLLADQPGHAADYSQGLLEARRRKRSVAGHPAAAGRHHRAALHAALCHQPAAPGLVSANQRRRRFPTACSRFPTSDRCWRCSAIRFWSNPTSRCVCKPGSGPSDSPRSPSPAAWPPGKAASGTDPLQAAAQEDAPPPRFSTILMWISLAACASTLLLATTSHLTQNVAPIPLLWIAPLSIYLLSFILAFESDKIYQRWLFLPLGLVALGAFTYGMSEYENNSDVIKRLIPMLCGALFISCMVCHGELAKRKPHPRYLTLFFLMVSRGRRDRRIVRRSDRAPDFPQLLGNADRHRRTGRADRHRAFLRR